MNYRVVIRDEAEADLREAFAWYERQRPGLGEQFLLAIEAALATIDRNPLLFAAVYRDIRRAVIRRFPFVVMYTFDNNMIRILAFFPARRNPRRWKQRAKNS